MRMFALFGLITMRTAVASAEPDPVAMQALLDQARAANSSAVVVMHRGKVIVEEYFDQPREPIEAMSVTKSVLGVAFGHLLHEGRIASLEQPVHAWFPEWKQGRKQTITLRHLMAHTSGLQNVPNTGIEIYPSPDFVQLAVAAELDADPGTVFAYNNKAVNLLPEIAKRATGQRVDAWLRAGLFRELDIREFDWTLDDAGHPHGMSGLQIHPRDLAKIGQLMLQSGRWNDRALLPGDWVEQSTAQPDAAPPGNGLLWFVTPQRVVHTLDDAHLSMLKAKGVDAALLDRLQPHLGKYEGDAYTTMLAQALGADFRTQVQSAFAQASERRLRLARPEFFGVKGYSARGYQGQYLVVYPAHELVAVRMIRQDRFRQEHGAGDEYGRFEPNVFALFDAPDGEATAR